MKVYLFIQDLLKKKSIHQVLEHMKLWIHLQRKHSLLALKLKKNLWNQCQDLDRMILNQMGPGQHLLLTELDRVNEKLLQDN